MSKLWTGPVNSLIPHTRVPGAGAKGMSFHASLMPTTKEKPARCVLRAGQDAMKGRRFDHRNDDPALFGRVQNAALNLIFFDRLKQRFEVPLAKAIIPFALDEFEKDRPDDSF